MKLGWADGAGCRYQGKALSVMETYIQFSRKLHKSSGYFKTPEERKLQLCFFITNRVLTS